MPLHRYLKKTGILLLFVAAGLLLSPAVGQAVDLDRAVFQQQIKTLEEGEPAPVEAALVKGWPKEITFAYKADETFDDNIFLTRKKKQNDWITGLDPEVQWTYQNAKNFVRLTGDLNTKIYAKNGHNTSLDPGLIADVELFKTSKIKLFLSDTMRHYTFIGSSSSEKPTKGLWNDLKLGALYDVTPKTSWRVDYGQKVSNFFTAPHKSDDRFENSITPSFQWHFSKKTTLHSSYTFGGHAYYHKNQGRNNVYHQVMEKIEGYITPKSKINFSAGYIYELYHSHDFKDFGDFIFSGGFDYSWTPKTSFRLFGSRSVADNLNWAPTSGDSVYNINTAAGLSISHQFVEKLSARLSGYYGRTSPGSNSEPPSTNYVNMTAGMGYQVTKFLSLMLSYEYRIAVSNAKENQYTNNRVSCALMGAFD